MTIKRPVLLIIDDEEPIRELIVDFLEDENFCDLLQAEDGHKALQILEDKKVDLCVVDLRMPVMDGLEFITRASARWPSIRYIVHTGTAEEALPEEIKDIMPMILTVLHKPILDYSILINTIRDSLR